MTMKNRQTRHCLLWRLLLLQNTSALIPATPREQTQRAIQSIRRARDEGARRLWVDYLLPLPPETSAADVDPWPGGLEQMYPYAQAVLQEILAGVVDDPASGPCSSQVISSSDCCGFLVQESQTSPGEDVAAILFPGVDQLDQIANVDRMVGDDRLLLLFNRQFQRPADFGFGATTSRANSVVFDRFQWGFAFQEFACRGEDVKLLYEMPNWQSFVICSEDEDVGAREIPLLEPSPTRPQYKELEKRINEVLPEPLWMRKMGEAESKGFKFQRGKKE